VVNHCPSCEANFALFGRRGKSAQLSVLNAEIARAMKKRSGCDLPAFRHFIAAVQKSCYLSIVEALDFKMLRQARLLIRRSLGRFGYDICSSDQRRDPFDDMKQLVSTSPLIFDIGAN
jgi:hypothetical protein